MVFPILVTQSLVVSQCDSDEECKAIELCEYESQIAYEKRFGELKFCGVYLKDVSGSKLRNNISSLFSHLV